MPRSKEHPELMHLTDIEYRRALNRINSNTFYRKKQIISLREKLARIEEAAVAATALLAAADIATAARSAAAKAVKAAAKMAIVCLISEEPQIVANSA